MLPGPLVSIYQQYKEDTDYVAAWLACTAKSCGYSPSGSTPSNTGKKATGKGKGKKSGKSSSSKATACKNVVAIKDFVPMAQIIASQKPAITVSQFFFKTLSRVIEVRSSFAARLATHGVAPDEESDQSHSHFVQVLQRVREILQPCCPFPSEMPSASTPAAGTVESITNIFDRLELYEPSQKLHSAPDIPKPEPIDQGHLYEAETPCSEQEAMITFALLIRDLDTIRETILCAWLRHTDQLLDLAACAVTTNTGIDLARSLIAQVEPELRQYGGLVGVCKIIFEGCARAGDCTDEHLADWSSCTTFDLYRVSSIVYFDILKMVKVLVSEISTKSNAIIKSGYTGMPDLTRTFEYKAGPDKFEHDKSKLAAL
ncbi:hypothetical protein ACHAPT_004285 [Fusarium lateritium]